MAQGSAVSWKTSHTDNGWMLAKIWTCVWMTETDLNNLSLLGSDITILLPFLLSRNGKKAKLLNQSNSYWIFLRPAMSFLSDKFQWSEIATWQLSNLTGFYLSSSTFRHNFGIFHIFFHHLCVFGWIYDSFFCACLHPNGQSGCMVMTVNSTRLVSAFYGYTNMTKYSYKKYL